MAKVAELFVGLTFKVQGQKEARDAGDSTQRIASLAARAAAALTGMAAGFGLVARGATQALTALSNFTTATGIDGGAFQRMAFEAGQAGVATQDLMGQLRELQTARNEVLLGMRAAPIAWGLMGVTPADSPMQMLEKMRKRIQSIQDTGMARTWAIQAGLSETMFVFLRRSNSEFETLNKNLELTEKQAAAGRTLSTTWLAFTAVLKGSAVRIFAEFVEPLTELLKVLTPVVVRFTEFVTWVLKLPVIGSAVKLFMLGFIGLVAGLAVALTGLAAILKLSPLLTFFSGAQWTALLARMGPILPVVIAIAAAVAIFALAVEDLWTYLKGGESVLGDIIGSLKALGDVFSTVEGKAAAAINKIKDFFIEYRKSGHFLGALTPATGPLGPIMRGGGELLKYLSKEPKAAETPDTGSAPAETPRPVVQWDMGNVLNWLDRTRPTPAPTTVTQVNSPSITVTAPAGTDEQGLSKLILKDIRGTYDAAYRQFMSNFSGPAEERP